MSRVVPVLITAALVALAVAVLVSTSLVGESSRPNVQNDYTKLTRGDEGFGEFPNEFAEFPLYWVGEEFAGHELRNIIRHVFSGETVLSPENSVTFIYGTCVIEPGPDGRIDGGCAPPVQVIVEPYCYTPPELVGNGTRPSGIEKMRGGADAIEVGGGTRLWTGDVTVKVYAPLELEDEVIAALTSPNGLGVTTGEDMPPPEQFECELPDWLID